MQHIGAAAVDLLRDLQTGGTMPARVLRADAYSPSFRSTRSLTAAGLALPPVAFIT